MSSDLSQASGEEMEIMERAFTDFAAEIHGMHAKNKNRHGRKQKKLLSTAEDAMKKLLANTKQAMLLAGEQVKKKSHQKLLEYVARLKSLKTPPPMCKIATHDAAHTVKKLRHRSALLRKEAAASIVDETGFDRKVDGVIRVLRIKLKTAMSGAKKQKSKADQNFKAILASLAEAQAQGGSDSGSDSDADW